MCSNLVVNLGGLNDWLPVRSQFKKLLNIIAIMSVFSLGACSPAPIKEVDKLAKRIYEEGKVKSHYFEDNGTRLHYVARGDQSKPVVVFLHGTPGGWGMFAHQLDSQELLAKAYLVSVERPGWGQSSSNEEDLYLSLALQAKLLAPLLSELRAKSESQKLILAGHSLGATLAPYVAMLYPELVDGTVSFAGDLTSEYLEKQWYNELLTWWIVKTLLPQMLTNSNDEVLALPKNLDDMNDYWSSLSSPLIVYQGGKDFLVDSRNADFARNLKTQSTVEVVLYPKNGHFIHLVKHQEVNKRMADFVEEILK